YNLCICDINRKVITFDDHPNGVIFLHWTIILILDSSSSSVLLFSGFEITASIISLELQNIINELNLQDPITAKEFICIDNEIPIESLSDK
ncbi:7939_t:CDS:1, partial [Rhizophagus irregularis]